LGFPTSILHHPEWLHSYKKQEMGCLPRPYHPRLLISLCKTSCPQYGDSCDHNLESKKPVGHPFQKQLKIFIWSDYWAASTWEVVKKMTKRLKKNWLITLSNCNSVIIPFISYDLRNGQNNGEEV
jgi:hypothetical protein